MMRSILQRFKRETYSTTYLPEVDGLRCIAILMVILIMHIPNYINKKIYNGQWLNDYWRHFSIEGGNGVTLFFVISGFILALPFARMYLLDREKVILKNYYLRRLTRLEPPYIIALLIFFAGNVWVLHNYTFSKLWPDFFSSMFYSNLIIHQRSSLILPVAWSLEIEIQFYLLAPLFFQSFRIRNPYLRRLIYLVVIGLAGWCIPRGNVAYIYNTVHCFFIGILLADLYCNKVRLIKNDRIALITGLLSIGGLFFISAVDDNNLLLHKPIGYFFKLLSIFLLFHIVLTNKAMKTFFSLPLLIIIGSMCYSLYLLHFGVISAVGRFFENPTGVHSTLYTVLVFIVLAVAVFVCSALYYLAIEKPFMKRSRFRKALQKQQELTSI